MTIFRFILLGGLLLIIEQRAVAQLQNRVLGVGGGFSPLQFKDYFHSDYTYRGAGLRLQAFYQQERRKTEWQLDAAYSLANPQSIVSRKATTRFMDVGFTYLWRLSAVSRPQRRFQYFAGPGLRLFGTSTNYSPDIDVSTVVATAAIAVGGSVKADYRIGTKQRIQAQLFAPLISTFYRPNYLYAGRDQVTASWVNQNVVFDGQVRYGYQPGNRFQVNVFYQFQYFRFEPPRPVIGLRQTIGIGIQRTF
ncbi:hypothetical protein ACFPMF_02185 [Larkinella bovis]|uniref:DUF481 domain-containing protein n=1 Tax=Larkinella bovis TaxID=683041 RepID=A0ABW0I7L6_9BACT